MNIFENDKNVFGSARPSRVTPRSVILRGLGILSTLLWLTNPGCSRKQEATNFADLINATNSTPLRSSTIAKTNAPLLTNAPSVPSEEAALNAAIATAKATSGDFVKAFHEQKPGTRGFHVKRPYPTPAGEVEHMWIRISSETNGVLNGTVVNEAEVTRAVKMGEKVSFPLSEISDWKYVDGKKLIGGFSIRYFYERMSPQEKEQFLKEAGFEF